MLIWKQNLLNGSASIISTDHTVHSEEKPLTKHSEKSYNHKQSMSHQSLDATL